LAAIALFSRGGHRCRTGLAAGLLAALAMQTKYTALLIPPILLWYGVTHHSVRSALLAVVVAVGGFAVWECLLLRQYGISHFGFHIAAQYANPQQTSLASICESKIALAPGLVAHFGCLAVGVGFCAIGSVGIPRRCLAGCAILWAFGLTLIVSVPWHVIIRGVPAFWQTFGILFFVAILAIALKQLRVRGSKDPAVSFLTGWLVIELAGAVVLTPFPAARRVIGLVIASGILVARAIGQSQSGTNPVRPNTWILAFGIAAGVAVAAIDTLDAIPEKYCALRASAEASQRAAGSTIWFAGHWGFQYYCERMGMRPVVPGESLLKAGDYLVWPAHPDSIGFYRPDFGAELQGPSKDVARKIGVIVWEDPIAAQTIPNYYGGIVPVEGRSYPRLRVVVYQMTSDWPARVQRR